MDKERIKGTAQKLKGSLEKAVGKLTGNAKLEARGNRNHAAGVIRTAVGTGKDAVRDAVKNRAN